MGGLVSALVWLVLSTAPSANAGYHLDWDGPHGCASAEEVRARIEVLGTRPKPGAEPLSARGRISADGAGGWRLRMTLETSGWRRNRELRHRECRALVDAAAFIIAVAIDPQVGESASPTPAASPPGTDRSPRPSSRPGGYMLAGGGMHAGTWPHAGAMVALALGLEGQKWRAEVEGVYDLPISVHVESLAGVAMEVQTGLVTLRGCAVQRYGRVVLPVCALGQMGAIDVRGQGLPLESRRRRPWVALGLGGGIEAQATPRLGLGLRLDAVAPLLRHRFVVGPRPELLVHETGVAQLRAVAIIRLGLW